ncbi:MAG: response regulator [Actinomycetota bacterium]|nr:response regulator [Actinomycetota bacterium]
MTERTILLLEDDPLLMRLLEVQLGTVGFRTVEARTVGDAWQRVQERHFDAAIVDVHLPDVHGWEFIERLRRDRTRERLPVLIVSGGIDQRDLRKASELRCDLMQKPFEPDDLLARVQHLIGYDRKAQLLTHAARVVLDSFALEGNVYLPRGGNRFSDGVEELMVDGRSFVPMTAVRAMTFDGQVLYEAPFVQVSKAHIRVVTALDDA